MTDDRPTEQLGAFDPHDIAAHATHDHVAAIFPNRALAAAAIDDLRRLGLGSHHLGVAVHGQDSILFEHDEDRELVRDTETGALLGAPIGAIAGLAVAGLAVPGIGLVGVGGMFAFAGASALWGGLIGGYLGATAGDRAWNVHRDFGYTALQPGEVLVVVCSHGHADAIDQVAARHEGRIHRVQPEHLGLPDA
jgi:hypothetical protein